MNINSNITDSGHLHMFAKRVMCRISAKKQFHNSAP